MGREGRLCNVLFYLNNQVCLSTLILSYFMSLGFGVCFHARCPSVHSNSRIVTFKFIISNKNRYNEFVTVTNGEMSCNMAVNLFEVVILHRKYFMYFR